MKTSSRDAMTTTIVAIVGSPLNAPARATPRDIATTSSDRAMAAPQPHDGPCRPATKPLAMPHAAANAAAIHVARSWPIHAAISVATAAATTGPSHSAAANPGHLECVPENAHDNAEGVPPSPHGAKASAS